ncbi:MAG: 30S ribosomal protein S20 [Dehalococcoidia bacterium]|nr:MAG: 30S ribosomal protein S20 [Dehalococcoidia bacterium]
MPLGSHSAAKAWRRSEQERLRNRARRSTAKTLVRSAELAMASADPQASAEAVRVAASALDQAAQKGALHQRSVARRKSRLMKKHSAVLATAVVAEEAAPVRKRRTKKKEAPTEEVAKKKRPSRKKKE